MGDGADDATDLAIQEWLDAGAEEPFMTDTAARAAMRLHNMLDNKMHLVRPVEVCAVIHAAQLVVTADDEYVADETEQYPHELLDAIDLLRERITALVGDSPTVKGEK